ncbi:hypothetical protein NE237_028519 [Protea cynaroides]|uniref:Uncharacterized protein n=1 Tax=Protea cynaroides TaxID=273540 RepID=A0A9Q0GTE7_9MAGN|nr:hypothetical protein NE237_028519 [Protea cynaroides]
MAPDRGIPTTPLMKPLVMGFRNRELVEWDDIEQQVPTVILSHGTVPSTVSSFIPRVGHPPHCVTAGPLGAPRSTTPLPTPAISPSAAPPQPGISFDSRLQPPSPTTPATMASHRDQNQESMGINSSSMPANLPSDNASVSSSPPASTRKSLHDRQKVFRSAIARLLGIDGLQGCKHDVFGDVAGGVQQIMVEGDGCEGLGSSCHGSVVIRWLDERVGWIRLQAPLQQGLWWGFIGEDLQVVGGCRSRRWAVE